MADGFGFIEKSLAIFENQDPNVERFSEVAISVRNFFQCYRIIYDEKKKRQFKLPSINSSVSVVIHKKTSNLWKISKKT